MGDRGKAHKVIDRIKIASPVVDGRGGELVSTLGFASSKISHHCQSRSGDSARE